jgi:thymidylate synthase (FAD)
MLEQVSVLDRGYVRYIKHMGSDLDVVNSAKVSFSKESGEFGEREARLLTFLSREEHTSVFRHSAITFEVYAPLMVARQWWKYVVASAHTEEQSGWNESSRRYITEEPTFYIPMDDEWRTAPDNKKQGSGEPLPHLTSDEFSRRKWDDHDMSFEPYEYGNHWTQHLESYIATGERLYDAALRAGVCAEQARLFLPAYGLYVRWRWTASLGAVLHFLHQRLEHDAQREIQAFAIAVKDLTAKHFPNTIETL